MDTTFKVVTKRITARANTPINLWIFGDVHYDTSSCDRDRFDRFLKDAARDDKENTYYLGMGDYIDFASTSEKKILTDSKIHETTREKLDFIAQRDNRQFAQKIRQMHGRTLGLIHGNHGWLFQDGKNSTEDLAERLKTDYLGWLCYYHLILEDTEGSNHRVCCVDLVMCHGKAGGKLMGTSINQVDDLRRIFPLADIYAMGHNHDRGAWPTDVLYYNPVAKKIKQKQQVFVRSGSFKKAYTEDTKGYEIGRLLRPANLGAVKLIITKRRTNDSVSVDINSYV